MGISSVLVVVRFAASSSICAPYVLGGPNDGISGVGRLRARIYGKSKSRSRTIFASPIRPRATAEVRADDCDRQPLLRTAR